MFSDGNVGDPLGPNGDGRFEILPAISAGGYDVIREWFRLKASSPAIDASVGSTEPLDHWGNSRDAHPDVGAHEY